MRRRIIVIIAPLAAIYLTVAIFSTLLQNTVQTAPTKPTERTIPLSADTIFNLVNEERIKAGVPPLVRDARLDQSAQTKADDMATNNYFAHINPTTGVNGYTLIPNGICSYKSENISMDWKTDEQVVDGWLGSKPHHDAMLDAQYDSTGVAVSGNKVVQHFCNLK